ncbi:hypothetical protein KTR10_00240 [Candidatus Kaiserbacteria bacterium]|nr:hypothetical protein [Candidatus Kaiserbacteria bacterium]
MNTESFFRWCVDTLFPPSEGALLVRNTTIHTLTPRPQSIDGVTHLLSFKDARVRACIHEAKFSGNTRAQRLLAYVLETHLKDRKVCIVPIPLSKKRLRERGYNQVARIAHYTHFPVHEKALSRTKHTTPQTDLPREARIENVRNIFASTGKYIYGKHVVLLDDVVTTGSTLREAQKALAHANPASITCIAMAH